MALLDQIKKGRKAERERFSHDLFHRLAFILKGKSAYDVKLLAGIELKGDKYLAERQKELLEMKVRASQKPNVDVPPFYLTSRDQVQPIKQVLKYANPYFAFANGSEEIIAANFLWQLNPNLDKEILAKNHLSNILYTEIAKPLLEDLGKKKKSLEKELEEVESEGFNNAFKKLASEAGMEHSPKQENEAKEFLKEIVEKARPSYVAWKIKEDLGLNVGKGDIERVLEKVVSKLVEKGPVESYVKTDGVKIGDYVKYKEEGGKTVEGKVNQRCGNGFHLDGEHYNPAGDIYKKVGGKGYLVESHLETLEIKPRDLLVSKGLGKEALEKLVAKKVEQYVQRIFEDIDETGEINVDKISDALIGRKVKIYPGGKERGVSNYDLGGSIGRVPIGSKGVIDSFYDKKNGGLMIKLQDGIGEKKDQLKGKYGWIVNIREIRLLGNSLIGFISDSYKVSEKAAEGILKGDYKALVKEHTKTGTSAIEKEISGIEKQIGYLGGFVK